MRISQLLFTNVMKTFIFAFCASLQTVWAQPNFGLIAQALKQANLTLDKVDLIELNEAFAAQALAVIQEAGLNPDIVNVNGGAIALGHPLGCTGAKLSVQLFNELRRQDKKYGMVTACVGGGQGIAGIYELLN